MSDMHGHITYVNPAYVKMWGYESQEEILGKHPTDMSHSADEISKVVTELTEQGSWVGEIVSKRKDARYSIHNYRPISCVIKLVSRHV